VLLKGRKRVGGAGCTKTCKFQNLSKNVKNIGLCTKTYKCPKMDKRDGRHLTRATKRNQDSRPREHHRDADIAQDALRASGQAGATRERATALGFGCCAFDDAVDEEQDDGAYY
jgi:hypothetical protein